MHWFIICITPMDEWRAMKDDAQEVAQVLDRQEVLLGASAEKRPRYSRIVLRE